MAITKNEGRQEVIAAKVDFDFNAFPANATYEAVNLPEGAVVVGGYLAVTTAFAGGVDITLTVSGGGASTGAIDADTGTSMNALTVDGTVVAAGGDTVDIASGGTVPTAGAGYLIVEYVVDGRAAFSEG